MLKIERRYRISRCLRIAWLTLATVYFAVLGNIQSANAKIVCKPGDDNVDCISTDSISDEVSRRTRLSVELFDKNLCRVNEISLSNDAWTKATTDEVEIYIRYECGYPQNEASSSNTQQNTKLRYQATARYEFLCAPHQYKMFESGFDFYSNGSRMHWDSQGSSRPIPWQNLPVEGRDRRLVSLFRLWCE